MTDRSQGAYYSAKLSGERLRRCYEVAPARVRQYLEAEILHARQRLRPTDRVLELGCGYGRVVRRLASAARRVVGIDTAIESLVLARQLSRVGDACDYLCMDALNLHFLDGSFDAVLCLQNGVCAFRVDQTSLLREALRVTREGGLVLFSSYSDKFWPHRLAWFEAQAAEGLVGPVDRVASGDGVIVCKDGFRAGRLTPNDFHALVSRIGVVADVAEVDESSVFCEVVKPGADPHDLERFVRAQEGDYHRALAEIRSGRKRTHWMWYVFPQFEGLGFSQTSRRYAIRSVEEAKAYLGHPILGPRLTQCAEATLLIQGRSAREIFGMPDDLKLRSCATLFAQVSSPGSVFHRLLDTYFGGQRDERTLRLMGMGPEAR